MTSPTSIDAIVSQVRQQFAGGVPNGWLLRWDEKRYFDEIAAAAKHWPTLNCTSFDYEFCNSYEILFDRLPTKRFRALTVLISFVAPVFELYWGQSDRTPSKISPKKWLNDAPLSRDQIAENIRRLLIGKGLVEIPEDALNVKIENVELELSGTTNVTLDKCLFRDHEG